MTPRHPFREALDAAGSSFASQCLGALERVGVLAELTAGPARSAEDLAAGGRLEVDRLRRLLDALTGEGTVVRDPSGRYRLAPAPLAATPPTGDLAALPGILRGGPPLDPADHAPQYHRALAVAGERVATELLATNPGLLRGEILDLGCGMGGYARAILDAPPGPESPVTRITLVDRPEILALAAAHLDAHRARIELSAGDLATPREHGLFDCVLLCDVIHHFDEGAAARLVAEAARRLRPVGTLVVVERDLDGDRRGPRAGLWFDVSLSLYTAQGRLHDREAISAWIRRAGLTAEPARVACDPDALVWLARRPAPER